MRAKKILCSILIVLFITASAFVLVVAWYNPNKPVKVNASSYEAKVKKTEVARLLGNALALDESKRILGTKVPIEVKKEGPKRLAKFAFNAIAPSWQANTPSGSQVLIQVRTSEDGAGWSSWRNVEADEDDGNDKVPSTRTYGRLIVVQGKYFQERTIFRTGSLDTIPSVKSLKLTYIDSKEKRNLLEKLLKRIKLKAKEAVASDLSTDPTDPPPICTRACWGADESIYVPGEDYAPVRKVIIHHTVTANNDSNPAATVRAIYYYHNVGRGWGDIGYNFVIDQNNGTIYEGRRGGDGVIGAHTSGYNAGGVGVAVLGDFRYVGVNKRVQNALHKIAVWKLHSHDINPDEVSVFGPSGLVLPTVFVHGRVANTACAGTHLNNFVPNLIAWAQYMPQQIFLTNSNGTQRIEGSIDQTTDDLLAVYARYGTVSPNYIRKLRPFLGDFNGDGQTDLAIWRPLSGQWYIKDVGLFQYGAFSDTPVPGDYNGDGTTDLAVWRPINGEWHIRNIGVIQYGGPGDTPVPGDYFGDRATDIAIWRPINGEWHIKDLGVFQYGASTDILVPRDYFGDDKTDIAIWRPVNGEWHIRNFELIQYGASSDIPIPGNYFDNSKDDIAIWRPVNGEWHIRNFGVIQYGASSDIPVPGDYFDDSKTDIAIWRPVNGEWHIRNFSVITDVTK